MILKYIQLVFLFFVIVLLSQCARRGSPSGGEKDETPPMLVSANPAMGTIHFKNKKIRLVFDELVITKDLRRQLIISPPLKNFPVISPTSASRWIEINISDTLKPNTTYVLNFGNSIQDYNENNPYPFFKYVFSTGGYIDSLRVRGRIKDAFANKTDNFVSVMLYQYDDSYSDSLVYKQPPMYITNTLDSLQTFEIENVRPGKYMLVAIKDKNNNYLFNQKEDKIAFSDSIINVGKDDSFHTLRLFKEIQNYKANRPFQMANNRIAFGFDGQAEKAKITPISEVSPDFKSFVTKEPEKDTLYYWYYPQQTDSIIFTVRHEKAIDTFRVRLKKTKTDSLELKTTFSGNIPFGKLFGWVSNTPIMKIDSTKVRIINKDSVAIPFKTKLEMNHLQMSVVFAPKYDEKYYITALPGAITDFFGQHNDTLKTVLHTKKQEEYAVLKMLVKMPLELPALMQLTDEKGNKIEKEIRVHKLQDEYIFENINPGKYNFRIILDSNDNGQWDTGNFLERKQPEQVFFHDKTIELRANWEVRETFINTQ